MTVTPPTPQPADSPAGPVPATPPTAAVTGSGLVARPAGVARSGRDRRHHSPRRGRHITAAFTDAEYSALAEAARRVGLTPTGFCAQAALAATTLRLVPGDVGPPTAPSVGVPAGLWADADPRVEALAQMQAELAALRTTVVRVGTNLNQAVAALHATGEAPVWLRHVVEQCGRALRAVDDAASRVHRRLCHDPEHHPRPTGARAAVLPVGSGQDGRSTPTRTWSPRGTAPATWPTSNRKSPRPAGGTSDTSPTCSTSRSGPGATRPANRCGTAPCARTPPTRS